MFIAIFLPDVCAYIKFMMILIRITNKLIRLSVI